MTQTLEALEQKLDSAEAEAKRLLLLQAFNEHHLEPVIAQTLEVAHGVPQLWNNPRLRWDLPEAELALVAGRVRSLEHRLAISCGYLSFLAKQVEAEGAVRVLGSREIARVASDYERANTRVDLDAAPRLRLPANLPPEPG